MTENECSLTVVCSKAVDNVQIFPECLHVLACSQHGSNLRSTVADLRHIILAQEEVVRGDLACDLDALLLRSSDYQDLKTIKKY